LDTYQNIPVTERPFKKEFSFQTARSSGPGGQHVNKTETKVELRFHIDNSQLLTEEEKDVLKKKLANRITNEGFLIITIQEYRSQFKNKQLAVELFLELLQKAFRKRKKRIPTKPTKSATEKRILEKKKTAEKKSTRGKPEME
jgi:ribosome-associated protein